MGTKIALLLLMTVSVGNAQQPKKINCPQLVKSATEANLEGLNNSELEDVLLDMGTCLQNDKSGVETFSLDIVYIRVMGERMARMQDFIAYHNMYSKYLAESKRGN